MLISLDWIRDFVDLPQDTDAFSLADRFTRTTAEVEKVLTVECEAQGLIPAKILEATEIPGTRNLRHAILDVGDGKNIETVTAAPVLPVGSVVVYAPPGSHVKAIGEIGQSEVAGKTSVGMILPGDVLGITMAMHEAVFLGGEVPLGEEIAPDLFDDYLIEVDNKSLTHRPDLWGHYGIAREIAAICKLPLKEYPVADLSEFANDKLPHIPIAISDPEACRRYSGVILAGVPTRPAALWMQLRLGRVGLRPISALVDLTNYIMTDLGQPMHAFDAEKVSRIEVDWAEDGSSFRTLDGMKRDLTDKTLMIKCQGNPIALAGVMGGLETEVTDTTTSLLLEAANFDAATTRRTATRLGLRTDASARFEKSLDPSNTALSIQRFVELAKPVFPDMEMRSQLSDCYPKPIEPITISVKPQHVMRTVGRTVPRSEVADIMEPLGFGVEEAGNLLDIHVPTFRATNDVTIEEDVIEEIARYIGYGTIPPTMPQVTVRRFEPNLLHDIEKDSLQYLSASERFVEIHGYLWYDGEWLSQLKIDPGTCIELSNPAAAGLERLRKDLIPGMLAAVVKNRFHFPAFSLVEVGSVFEQVDNADVETKHLGLVKARRGKKAEAQVYSELKGAIDRWSWQLFAQSVSYVPVKGRDNCPWERDSHCVEVRLGDHTIGRIGVVDLPLRREMDEHLAAWAIAWAELNLDALTSIAHATEPMGKIPEQPLVESDFSFVVAASHHYSQVADKLAKYKHDLLRQISYVGAFEGKPIKEGFRSLTFRTLIGDQTRTLTESDTNLFRKDFEKYLTSCGYEIRT